MLAMRRLWSDPVFLKMIQNGQPAIDAGAAPGPAAPAGVDQIEPMTTTTMSARSESAGPALASGDDAPVAGESTFEENFKSIRADLSAVLADKPPDQASKAIQSKIEFVRDTMLEAASEQDFALATEYLDELPGLIADYRKAVEAFRIKNAADQAAAKSAYEKKLQPLAAGMRRVLTSHPAAPSAKKIQSDLARVYEAITVAANTGAYDAASKQLDAVPPLIDGYDKEIGAQTTGKQEYLEQYKSIKDVLHRTIDELPSAGPPLQIHDELVDSAYTMESAAAIARLSRITSRSWPPRMPPRPSTTRKSALSPQR
jgi:hypothetical protein